MNDDWIDNILDGEPSGITDTQWLIIESNIDQTSLTISMKSDILSRINDLTELEAEEIITKIYENRYEKDTRKQWQKMFKDGVFGHRDF
tara:strand:+ start:266 stop:532 length:267 start_codon:yes stop_codon:yes gene_type:complete